MSLKKHQFWVMMPVLGILLMSPRELEVKYGRHIASDEPAPQAEVARSESKTPKLDQLLSNVEIPSRPNPLNLNSDMLKEDITTLLSRVSKAEEFDKKTVEKPALDHLREEIKTSAIELRQVENSIKDLMNPDDEGDIRPRIEEAKIHLEASLKDLSDTEALVAARSNTPAPETPAPQVANTPAPNSTVRAPSVVPEETQVEPAKPTAASTASVTTEKDPILCALEEQNKLLTQQLQNFVQQQGLIMTQLMQLSNMVMMQNMYRTPDTFNHQQMYPYTSGTQGQGAWVYYPNGAQAIQPAQPQMQAQQPQQQQNMFGVNPYGQFSYNPYPTYGMGGMNNMSEINGMNGGYTYGMQSPQVPFPQPGMMGQGGGQWGLAPQSSFTHNPGSFGMDAIGFNMSPSISMMR